MAWAEWWDIERPSLDTWFNIHAVSDMQIGSRACYLPLLRHTIREIEHDRDDCGVVISGDIEDEDRPSTRLVREGAFAGRREVITRDAEKHKSWIDRTIIPELLPLTKTKYGILGILAGHHWTILGYKGTPDNPSSEPFTSAEYISQQLAIKSGRRVPFMGIQSAWLMLRVGVKGWKGKGDSGRKLTQRGHVQHGAGGGSAVGGGLRRLVQTRAGFPADFLVRAHDCRLEATKVPELWPKHEFGSSEVMGRNVPLLNTGSMTQGYSVTKGQPDYPEDAMLPPLAMGWGFIRCKLRKAHTWEDSNSNLKMEYRVDI